MDIPKELDKAIDYLAWSFSKSLHSVVNSKEDLKQELYIFYLEQLPKGKIRDNGGWFIAFKNYLLSKYIKQQRRDNIAKEEYINDVVYAGDNSTLLDIIEIDDGIYKVSKDNYTLNSCESTE